MTAWELIAPGVLPTVPAIVALVITGRARAGERPDRINAAITDPAQRLAGVEGPRAVSTEREAA